MDTNNEKMPMMVKNEEKTPFYSRHWVLLIMAFVFSASFVIVYDLPELKALPGISCTACAYLLLGTFLLFYRKNLVFTRQNTFMLGVCVLTALTYAIYSNQVLRLMNLPLIIGSGALAMYSLMGHSLTSPMEASAPFETLGKLIPDMFKNFARPFTALKEGKSSLLRKTALILLALVISIPLLTIVLALLSSADAVFGNMLKDLADVFYDAGIGKIVRKCISALIIGFMTFSLLYSIGFVSEKKGKNTSEGTNSSLVAGVTVLLLDVVYALFIFVQFAYFFGGRETAVMEGGYAEYARSGFFQLVAVAAINIAVMAVVNRFFARKIPLTALCMILDAATGVILVSAAWRMSLYIRVYGMSFLRILTIWGMFAIGVGIVLTAVKTINVDSKIFPVFIAITLSSWLMFNYMNVDRVIAKYNVDMYLEDTTQTLDHIYLSDLSPSVIPELERLSEAGDEPARFADIAIRRIVNDNDDIGWREWSFSMLNLRGYNK